MQSTLSRSVQFSGTGLHSGQPAHISLHPAAADHGIAFRRIDLPGVPLIAARHDLVEVAPLCTCLKQGAASVMTIEHLMAALGALGIDNVEIRTNGPEVPIMDGSARPFIDALARVGTHALPARRKQIRVLESVRVTREDGAWAEIGPGQGLTLDVSIDFPHPAIGYQSACLDMRTERFAEEIASARTFCLERDIAMMHLAGRALGGSTQNAVVFGESGPVEGQRLRYDTEPARHKLLDALGDLTLAGYPLKGTFRSYKPGHSLTNALLCALVSKPRAWLLEDFHEDRHLQFA